MGATYAVAVARQVHNRYAAQGGVEWLEHDGGTEIVNHQVELMCAAEGIRMTEFVPHNPASRGGTEIAHKSLGNTVRALLIESGVGAKNNGYVFLHAHA